MMPRTMGTSIRLAGQDDSLKLSSFLTYRSHVHRHLDWRTPVEWLGSQPFLFAGNEDELLAVFACPPDPPSIAWIRLFSAANESSPTRLWNMLLERAMNDLKGSPSSYIAGLALQSWFEDLLIGSHFTTQQSIIVLEWDNQPPVCQPLAPKFNLRPMTLADLDGVTQVDHLAFEPLWHNSSVSLALAYHQSAFSTVIELDHQIIGYQISNSITFSGHLARLAVLPSYQGQGLGYALVSRLLSDFSQHGIGHITVNTQNDNLSSLALYTRTGFQLTGDEFPVYLRPI
jgi:ribosomal protein S18 acetylase RimI-like enzyme